MLEMPVLENQRLCIIATTDFDNAGSIAVMKRLGMQIAHNPQPTLPWLHVAGVLERDQWGL